MSLARADVLRVAVEACVDPRTVERALAGRTRGQLVRSTIHAALIRLGFRKEAMALERRAMHTPKRKRKEEEKSK